MRILWISNQALPEIGRDLGLTIGNGGTWMVEPSRQIAKEHTLGMTFPVNVKKQYLRGEKDKIIYYAIPMNNIQTQVEEKTIDYFEKIIKEFEPDVIHIWGTEYAHSYLALLAAQKLGMLEHTIISIQGMVSVFAKHFYGHIERRLIRESIKDHVFGWGTKEQWISFQKRGRLEQESIRLARHVMGRTDWDKACTTQINPKIKYHFCNETLRSSFYENHWELQGCERHSLFVSQSFYPLKGFHHALEAVAILKEQWPDVHLYTTGRNLITEDWKEKLLDSGYEKYLRKIIKENHLEEYVTYLPHLSEQQMCDRFCKSHVFVSASSIENSPNSVGEAMLLGVPVVSSDVGGVKNMLVHEKDGFVYQPDASYMLAFYIDEIFRSDALAEKFSRNAREHGKQIFDREVNYRTMIEIYETLKKS